MYIFTNDAAVRSVDERSPPRTAASFHPRVEGAFDLSGSGGDGDKKGSDEGFDLPQKSEPDGSQRPFPGEHCRR